MPRLTISEVRAELSETISRVEQKGERIILRRRGRDVAVLVPLQDLALLEQVEHQSDRRDARQALEEPGERIPYEQLRRELLLD